MPERLVLPIEIVSYQLEVQLLSDPPSINVDATLRVANRYYKPVGGFTLYLHPELAVASIRDPLGRSLRYGSATEESDWSYVRSLTAYQIDLRDAVLPGATQDIHVEYAGVFTRSDRRSPSDFMRIDTEGAFLRGLGYSVWFPVVDPSAIDAVAQFRLHIRTPAPWRSVAFGVLSETAEDRGCRTSLWETSTPFKLIQSQLFAGPYSVYESRQVSVYSVRFDNAPSERILSVCDRLLDFYNAHLRTSENRDLYYIVETCPYGCIASGNVVGLSPEVFDQFTKGSPGFEILDLVAHELVHGFVTPLIERQAPGAALLLEGFPSYFHVPAATTVWGNAYREWFLQRAWESYWSGQPQSGDDPTDHFFLRDKPLIDIAIDEIPRYKDRFLLSDKFPILLDRLRVMLGDGAFLSACRDFFSQGMTRNMTFREFVTILESQSGQELSEFYDRWFASTEPLPTNWADEPCQS
jgi:hypothetical protein